MHAALSLNSNIQKPFQSRLSCAAKWIKAAPKGAPFRAAAYPLGAQTPMVSSAAMAASDEKHLVSGSAQMEEREEIELDELL